MRSRQAELKLGPFRVRSAGLCNGVEEMRRRLPVMSKSVLIPYEANRFVTVRLELESEALARK